MLSKPWKRSLLNFGLGEWNSVIPGEAGPTVNKGAYRRIVSTNQKALLAYINRAVFGVVNVDEISYFKKETITERIPDGCTGFSPIETIFRPIRDSHWPLAVRIQNFNKWSDSQFRNCACRTCTINVCVFYTSPNNFIKSNRPVSKQALYISRVLLIGLESNMVLFCLKNSVNTNTIKLVLSIHGF